MNYDFSYSQFLTLYREPMNQMLTQSIPYSWHCTLSLWLHIEKLWSWSVIGSQSYTSLNIEPSYRADQGNMDWTVWMKMCLWWTCVPNYCVLKLLCDSFIIPHIIDFVHIWAYVLLFHGVLILLHGPKSTQESVLQNVICNNYKRLLKSFWGEL